MNIKFYFELVVYNSLGFYSMLCLTILDQISPNSYKLSQGSTKYPVNQQVLEFRNRTTYSMNHTLVKYIEEESE